MEETPMWEQSETWTSAMQELEDNVHYCQERSVPVCTIHVNIYLERMPGFKSFLSAVRAKYEHMTFSVDTFYDNFNSCGTRNAGHFMYYSITLSVVLA